MDDDVSLLPRLRNMPKSWKHIDVVVQNLQKIRLVHVIVLQYRPWSLLVILLVLAVGYCCSELAVSMCWYLYALHGDGLFCGGDQVSHWKTLGK